MEFSLPSLPALRSILQLLSAKVFGRSPPKKVQNRKKMTGKLEENPPFGNRIAQFGIRESHFPEEMQIG
jgi:hypothetical protein